MGWRWQRHPCRMSPCSSRQRHDGSRTPRSPIATSWPTRSRWRPRFPRATRRMSRHHPVPAPLFHIYGLTVDMNYAMLTGATLILIPRFDPEMVLKATKHRPRLFQAPRSCTRRSPPSRRWEIRPLEHRGVHQRRRSVAARGPARLRAGHRRPRRRGIRPDRGLAGDALQPGARGSGESAPSACRSCPPKRGSSIR